MEKASTASNFLALTLQLLNWEQRQFWDFFREEAYWHQSDGSVVVGGMSGDCIGMFGGCRMEYWLWI